MWANKSFSSAGFRRMMRLSTRITCSHPSKRRSSSAAPLVTVLVLVLPTTLLLCLVVVVGSLAAISDASPMLGPFLLALALLLLLLLLLPLSLQLSSPRESA
jgi:hypothetical protein